jgi:hypothetical protein
MEHLSGVSETLVFNLATLYELESSKAAIKKRVRPQFLQNVGTNQFSPQTLTRALSSSLPTQSQIPLVMERASDGFDIASLRL